MTSTDSPTGDHGYFQAIEESFIRLRGAPLLLSPSDWQLARQWRQEGIPLDLVLATLEKVFAQREARGAKGRIQGLRYFADAVTQAWHEHHSLVATGDRRELPEMDVPGRLEALAAALPESVPDREQISERLRALAGTSEDVERSLMEIDHELIALVSDSLDPAIRRAIERSVETALANLASRISPEDRSIIRDRLYRQTLRRRAHLPVLSLFAPEADPQV